MPYSISWLHVEGWLDVYHGEQAAWHALHWRHGARVDQHRRDVGSAYCRRYGIKTLVLIESHDDIYAAIIREKALKAWKRGWKIKLIEESNPNWDDLFDGLA